NLGEWLLCSIKDHLNSKLNRKLRQRVRFLHPSSLPIQTVRSTVNKRIESMTGLPMISMVSIKQSPSYMPSPYWQVDALDHYLLQLVSRFTTVILESVADNDRVQGFVHKLCMLG